MNLERIDIQIQQEKLINEILAFVTNVDNSYNNTWQSSVDFEFEERYYNASDERLKLIFSCSPPVFKELVLTESRFSKFWTGYTYEYSLTLVNRVEMTDKEIEIELNRFQYEKLYYKFTSINKQIINYRAECKYNLQNDIIGELKHLNSCHERK